MFKWLAGLFSNDPPQDANAELTAVTEAQRQRAVQVKQHICWMSSDVACKHRSKGFFAYLEDVKAEAKSKDPSFTHDELNLIADKHRIDWFLEISSQRLAKATLDELLDPSVQDGEHENVFIRACQEEAYRRGAIFGNQRISESSERNHIQECWRSEFIEAAWRKARINMINKHLK